MKLFFQINMKKIRNALDLLPGIAKAVDQNILWLYIPVHGIVVPVEKP